MVVYCYDLARKRSRFTPEMDAFLRAEWFPGLALAQLTVSFYERFRLSGFPSVHEKVIANRLSELGMRNRMTGEAKTSV